MEIPPIPKPPMIKEEEDLDDDLIFVDDSQQRKEEIENWNKKFLEHLQSCKGKKDSCKFWKVLRAYRKSLKEDKVRFHWDKEHVTTRLRQHIQRLQLTFETCNGLSKEDFQSNMEDVLASYCEFELDILQRVRFAELSSRQYKKIVRRTAFKMMSVISLYMENDMRHIIHIFLKIKLPALSFIVRDTLKLFYTHVILRNPVVDISDLSFVRYYLVFHRLMDLCRLSDARLLTRCLTQKFSVREEPWDRSKVFQEIVRQPTGTSSAQTISNLSNLKTLMIEKYFEYIDDNDDLRDITASITGTEISKRAHHLPHEKKTDDDDIVLIENGVHVIDLANDDVEMTVYERESDRKKKAVTQVKIEKEKKKKKKPWVYSIVCEILDSDDGHSDSGESDTPEEHIDVKPSTSQLLTKCLAPPKIELDESPLIDNDQKDVTGDRDELWVEFGDLEHDDFFIFPGISMFGHEQTQIKEEQDYPMDIILFPSEDDTEELPDRPPKRNVMRELLETVTAEREADLAMRETLLARSAYETPSFANLGPVGTHVTHAQTESNKNTNTEIPKEAENSARGTITVMEVSDAIEMLAHDKHVGPSQTTMSLIPELDRNQFILQVITELIDAVISEDIRSDSIGITESSATQNLSENTSSEIFPILPENTSIIPPKQLFLVPSKDIFLVPPENLPLASSENLPLVPSENLPLVPPENLSSVQSENVSLVPSENLSSVQSENLSLVPSENLSLLTSENSSLVTSENMPLVTSESLTLVSYEIDNLPLTEPDNLSPTESDNLPAVQSDNLAVVELENLLVQSEDVSEDPITTENVSESEVNVTEDGNAKKVTCTATSPESILPVTLAESEERPNTGEEDDVDDSAHADELLDCCWSGPLQPVQVESHSDIGSQYYENSDQIENTNLFGLADGHVTLSDENVLGESPNSPTDSPAFEPLDRNDYCDYIANDFPNVRLNQKRRIMFSDVVSTKYISPRKADRELVLRPFRGLKCFVHGTDEKVFTKAEVAIKHISNYLIKKYNVKNLPMHNTSSSCIKQKINFPKRGKSDDSFNSTSLSPSTNSGTVELNTSETSDAGKSPEDRISFDFEPIPGPSHTHFSDEETTFPDTIERQLEIMFSQEVVVDSPAIDAVNETVRSPDSVDASVADVFSAHVVESLRSEVVDEVCSSSSIDRFSSERIDDVQCDSFGGDTDISDRVQPDALNYTARGPHTPQTPLPPDVCLQSDIDETNSQTDIETEQHILFVSSPERCVIHSCPSPDDTDTQIDQVSFSIQQHISTASNTALHDIHHSPHEIIHSCHSPQTDDISPEIYKETEQDRLSESSVTGCIVAQSSNNDNIRIITDTILSSHDVLEPSQSVRTENELASQVGAQADTYSDCSVATSHTDDNVKLPRVETIYTELKDPRLEGAYGSRNPRMEVERSAFGGIERERSVTPSHDDNDDSSSAVVAIDRSDRNEFTRDNSLDRYLLSLSKKSKSLPYLTIKLPEPTDEESQETVMEEVYVNIGSGCDDAPMECDNLTGLASPTNADVHAHVDERHFAGNDDNVREGHETTEHSVEQTGPEEVDTAEITETPILEELPAQAEPIERSATPKLGDDNGERCDLPVEKSLSPVPDTLTENPQANEEIVPHQQGLDKDRKVAVSSAGRAYKKSKKSVKRRAPVIIKKKIPPPSKEDLLHKMPALIKVFGRRATSEQWLDKDVTEPVGASDDSDSESEVEETIKGVPIETVKYEPIGKIVVRKDEHRQYYCRAAMDGSSSGSANDTDQRLGNITVRAQPGPSKEATCADYEQKTKRRKRALSVSHHRLSDGDEHRPRKQRKRAMSTTQKDKRQKKDHLLLTDRMRNAHSGGLKCKATDVLGVKRDRAERQRDVQRVTQSAQMPQAAERLVNRDDFEDVQQDLPLTSQTVCLDTAEMKKGRRDETNERSAEMEESADWAVRRTRKRSKSDSSSHHVVKAPRMEKKTKTPRGGCSRRSNNWDPTYQPKLRRSDAEMLCYGRYHTRQWDKTHQPQVTVVEDPKTKAHTFSSGIIDSDGSEDETHPKTVTCLGHSLESDDADAGAGKISDVCQPHRDVNTSSDSDDDAHANQPQKFRYPEAASDSRDQLKERNVLGADNGEGSVSGDDSEEAEKLRERRSKCTKSDESDSAADAAEYVDDGNVGAESGTESDATTDDENKSDTSGNHCHKNAEHDAAELNQHHHSCSPNFENHVSALDTSHNEADIQISPRSDTEMEDNDEQMLSVRSTGSKREHHSRIDTCTDEYDTYNDKFTGVYADLTGGFDHTNSSSGWGNEEPVGEREETGPSESKRDTERRMSESESERENEESEIEVAPTSQVIETERECSLALDSTPNPQITIESIEPETDFPCLSMDQDLLRLQANYSSNLHDVLMESRQRQNREHLAQERRNALFAQQQTESNVIESSFTPRQAPVSVATLSDENQTTVGTTNERNVQFNQSETGTVDRDTRDYNLRVLSSALFGENSGNVETNLLADYERICEYARLQCERVRESERERERQRAIACETRNMRPSTSTRECEIANSTAYEVRSARQYETLGVRGEYAVGGTREYAMGSARENARECEIRSVSQYQMRREYGVESEYEVRSARENAVGSARERGTGSAREYETVLASHTNSNDSTWSGGRAFLESHERSDIHNRTVDNSFVCTNAQPQYSTVRHSLVDLPRRDLSYRYSGAPYQPQRPRLLNCTNHTVTSSRFVGRYSGPFVNHSQMPQHFTHPLMQYNNQVGLPDSEQISNTLPLNCQCQTAHDEGTPNRSSPQQSVPSASHEYVGFTTSANVNSMNVSHVGLSVAHGTLNISRDNRRSLENLQRSSDTPLPSVSGLSQHEINRFQANREYGNFETGLCTANDSAESHSNQRSANHLEPADGTSRELSLNSDGLNNTRSSVAIGLDSPQIARQSESTVNDSSHLRWDSTMQWVFSSSVSTSVEISTSQVLRDASRRAVPHRRTSNSSNAFPENSSNPLLENASHQMAGRSPNRLVASTASHETWSDLSVQSQGSGLNRLQVGGGNRSDMNSNSSAQSCFNRPSNESAACTETRQTDSTRTDNDTPRNVTQTHGDGQTEVDGSEHRDMSAGDFVESGEHSRTSGSANVQTPSEPAPADRDSWWKKRILNQERRKQNDTSTLAGPIVLRERPGPPQTANPGDNESLLITETYNVTNHTFHSPNFCMTINNFTPAPDSPCPTLTS